MFLLWILRKFLRRHFLQNTSEWLLLYFEFYKNAYITVFAGEQKKYREESEVQNSESMYILEKISMSSLLYLQINQIKCSLIEIFSAK